MVILYDKREPYYDAEPERRMERQAALPPQDFNGISPTFAADHRNQTGGRRYIRTFSNTTDEQRISLPLLLSQPGYD
jgi:hypothetical protein